jgi:DNA-binding LacI/PurR family transcriptional regulator
MAENKFNNQMFDEYIVQGDGSRKQRAENWQIAIGLQDVDRWNVGSISGIHIAVQYLLKLGHRNIRYISLEGLHAEETKPTKRWQGFLQEMTRAGIQNPETMAIFCSETDAVSELVRSIDAARRDGCTALITVNALHTLKVHAALHRLNLQIPQDISVIDWEYTGVSEYLDPPRTTVGVDYARMAQEAVDLLENILDGSGPVGNRRVPSKLILRESCGQCR